MAASELPIDDALPLLQKTLAKNPRAVLHAPPGAGKTTRVPPALLREPWLGGKKILMLEPRRLAARMAATFMARNREEEPGGIVGFRTRLETRVSKKTRIEVVTEGILTRMLQEDPGLEEFGIVIFDEFHERHIQSDLGLALTLDASEKLRPELRLLVMSATLDAERIAGLIGGADIVRAEGRIFPVEVIHVETPRRARIEDTLPSVIERALREQSGDLLVFLPGAREIRRVESALAERIDPSIRVYPLFGDLSREAQDAAVTPAPRGIRKIILSTNIAETSLTIEGVGAVVDCGLVRRSVFSPGTGMSRLETTRISRASAEQRAGRAGRLGPGRCYRMWGKLDHASLDPFTPPEILHSDLAPLALELLRWGVNDPRELRWLDPPPEGLWNEALRLLEALGASGKDGRLSREGREMTRTGSHPRLARMLRAAKNLGLTGTACDLAALLDERDFLPGAGVSAAKRLDRIREARLGRGSRETTRIPGSLLRNAELLRRRVGMDAEPGRIGSPEEVGLLLSFAFPDRIGKRRDSAGRFLLANGRGATVPESDILARRDWIVAAHLDDAGADGRVLLAETLEETSLLEARADLIEEKQIVEWDDKERAVVSRSEKRIGAIVISSRPIENTGEKRLSEVFLSGIRKLGMSALPWDEESRALQARVAFLRRNIPDYSWPDFSNERLLETIEEWLAPWIEGMRRAAQLQRLDLSEILLSPLSHETRSRIEKEAPAQLAVPSGSCPRLEWLCDDPPVLRVKLQELFGLGETPRVAQGRVPVTLHLLSPAGRPVQVTRDLTSFWHTTYPDVRKELRGRYPRHPWPQDPWTATPTRRVKPRGK